MFESFVTVLRALHSLLFFDRKQRVPMQFGDCFALNLAGQRMVFMFDLWQVQQFFKAPEELITFR